MEKDEGEGWKDLALRLRAQLDDANEHHVRIFGYGFATGLAVAVLLALLAIGLARFAHAEDRMPLEQSQEIKRSMLPPGGQMRDYELDHIVPLCMGGSNDRSNLQLQPWAEANQKDDDERKLCQEVYHGYPRDKAQQEMRDWRRKHGYENGTR